MSDQKLVALVTGVGTLVGLKARESDELTHLTMLGDDNTYHPVPFDVGQLDLDSVGDIVHQVMPSNVLVRTEVPVGSRHDFVRKFVEYWGLEM